MADLKFLKLWDVYSPLLTPTQREITDMFFNLDLTVSEIAEQKGISRQGVSECLSSAKKQMEEYESKLGFSSATQGLTLAYSMLVKSVKAWSEELKGAHPELTAEAEGLDKILSADYLAEAQTLLGGNDKE